MTEWPFADLSRVELYDGTGRHLGGIHPPLAVDNVLTEAFYEHKVSRPIVEAFYLDDEVDRNDVALVWMLPLGTTTTTPIPAAIYGEIVQAVDARKMVVVHGDDPDVVLQIKAVVSAFAGGGHA